MVFVHVEVQHFFSPILSSSVLQTVYMSRIKGDLFYAVSYMTDTASCYVGYTNTVCTDDNIELADIF